MNHRRLKLLGGLTALIAVCSVLVAVALTAAREAETQRDIAESEITNAPDLLIGDVDSVRYPDPLHLRLPDKRLFRFARVLCPEAGTPEYAKALDLVSTLLAWHGNRLKGLRTLGESATGEPLVEPWAFQLDIPVCGNLHPAEKWSLRIPHWKNLSVRLVSSGLFWLEPGVTDPELLNVERSARKQGLGIWADPLYLRRLVDLASCEALLRHPSEPWGPELRDRRLESADLLLRADAGAYVPRLLEVVRDPTEPDVHARVQIAQLLDKAGYPEGTEFLMEAIRRRGGAAGLREGELEWIRLDDAAYRWQRVRERENAAIGYYNNALRHQDAGNLPEAIADLQKALLEAPPGWPTRRLAGNRLTQLQGKRQAPVGPIRSQTDNR